MEEVTERITGTDIDKATTSSNDTTVAHTTASLPNSYPRQPFAPIHVAWGVLCKANAPDPAVMTSVIDSIHCSTDLTNYVTDIPSAALSTYNLWAQFAALPAGNVEIHWSIDIDNVTAPPYAAGAYPMKKMHMDGHLSYMNVAYDSATGTILNDSQQSINAIQTPILENIQFLRSIAKY